MLAKLIKYDMKSQSKIFVSMYIFDLILAVFGLILSKISHFYPKSYIFSGINQLFFAVLILGLVITAVVTLILTVMRYRTNLLRDEGYLMHTLPVKVSQLYFSKLISSVLWFIIDAAVVYIVVAIRLLDFTWIAKFISELLKESGNQGIDVTVILVSMIFYMMVALVVSLTQFFAALSTGYSLNIRREGRVNKDLLSIIVYILSYILIQIMSMAGIAVDVFIKGINVNKAASAMSNTEVVSTVTGIISTQTVILILLGIFFAAVSIMRMKKHLNLE